MIIIDDKTKFELTKDMCELKKQIVSYLFDKVSQKPHDRWWTYKGEFVYEGDHYLLECDCRCDNQMFTYKNLHIEHKQVVIDLDEMIKAGIIQ